MTVLLEAGANAKAHTEARDEAVLRSTRPLPACAPIISPLPPAQLIGAGAQPQTRTRATLTRRNRPLSFLLPRPADEDDGSARGCAGRKRRDDRAARGARGGRERV